MENLFFKYIGQKSSNGIYFLIKSETIKLGMNFNLFEKMKGNLNILFQVYQLTKMEDY